MSRTHRDATSEPHAGQVRRARIALFSLLLLTGGLAAGILSVKFKLETLRAAVEEEAISRIGVRLDGGSVQVNGLRGLRIDAFRATLRVPLGPDLQIAVPRALVDIDLADLFSGRMTIDRVNIDHAHIVLRREAGGAWFNPANRSGHSLAAAISFRLTGRGCVLEIPEESSAPGVRLVDLDLDLAKLTGSQDLLANIAGRLDSASKGAFDAKLRFASMEDFDLRLNSDTLTAQDINAYLPIQERFLHTGTVTPKIQVNGYPDKNLVVSVEMGFENLLLRDQPPVVHALNGRLTALANYSLDEHVLTLATAKVSSDQLSGQLEGGIRLGGPLPEFDLRLNADGLPLMDALTYELPGNLERFGTFSVALEEPEDIGLRLRGTPEAPRINVEAHLPGGTFVFVPIDKRFPALDFELGDVLLEWDAQGESPRGSLDIVNGTLRHKYYGIECENLRGRLLLDAGKVSLDALNGRIGANPLMLQAEYDIAKNVLDFSLNGVLAELERTPFPGMVPKADFAGAVSVDCKGVIAEGQHIYDLRVDATQAWLELNWWFLKPIGTGLGVEAMHVDYRPGKTVDITASRIHVDTTVLDAKLHATRRGGTWTADSLEAGIDSFDLVAAGKCVRVPYAITGGACRNFAFARNLDPESGAETITLAGAVDTLTFRPRDSEAVAEIRDAGFEAVMNKAGETLTGSIAVRAATANVPPLRAGWLRSLRPDDPTLDKKYPRVHRRWEIAVTADRLTMPPWQGTGFALAGWTDPETLELSSFGAAIGEGRLEGTYRAERGDNVARLEAQWTEVPATTLLRYLELPEMLTGTISGGIHYSVDRDDPATLRGTGNFGISDGQFSADYLFDKFEEQLSGDISALPGSLKFTRFGADVELTGDIVKTENLVLEAEALRISGAGQFTVGGDMDYTLKVALPPETAERIPALASNLNLEGHKLAQRDVELGFHVTGPSFSPNAEVTGLPSVGDTIFSGAAEVGKEVGKVIDTPRQIIMDLFRIMGGIVASPGRDGNKENGRESRQIRR